MDKIFTITLFEWMFLNILFTHGANQLECNYDSSENISSGILNDNRSITYNGKLFWFGLYSMVNYTIENEVKKEVEPYPRACIYEDRLPCKFSESINITGGLIDENGLIRFDHMEFPIGTYANISFKYKIKTFENTFDHFTRVETPEYVRGCVCNRKSCVRFCCPSPYHIFVHGNCKLKQQHDVNLPIRNNNNDFSMENFKDHFYYVTSKFCGTLTQPEDDFEVHHVSFHYTK